MFLFFSMALIINVISAIKFQIENLSLQLEIIENQENSSCDQIINSEFPNSKFQFQKIFLLYFDLSKVHIFWVHKNSKNKQKFGFNKINQILVPTLFKKTKQSKQSIG